MVALATARTVARGAHSEKGMALSGRRL